MRLISHPKDTALPASSVLDRNLQQLSERASSNLRFWSLLSFLLKVLQCHVNEAHHSVSPVPTSLLPRTPSPVFSRFALLSSCPQLMLWKHIQTWALRSRRDPSAAKLPVLCWAAVAVGVRGGTGASSQEVLLQSTWQNQCFSQMFWCYWSGIFLIKKPNGIFLTVSKYLRFLRALYLSTVSLLYLTSIKGALLPILFDELLSYCFQSYLFC